MQGHGVGEPSGLTRVEGVMVEIQARIAGRRLAPGARLPSVRDYATRSGVSKSTVVEAYDRLIATGAITARRGSGFYVAGTTRPLSLQSLRPELERAIDPLWVTRQAFSSGAEVLKPGFGMLPRSFMPDASLQKALRHLARDPTADDRIRYSTPLGFAPLRQYLAGKLAERGIGVAPDGIMLTDSASAAIDLACRFLIEPGETVLVDDPCYFNFLAMLLSHRAKVIGVPYGADGPDVEAFGQALAAHRPRLYLTTGGLHNPTGGTISAAKAHRLLKLAEQHDIVIIEDDTFADLEHELSPRLAGFDGLDRVIQVGGYAKTVSSAVRCGYIAARPDWLDALVDLKLSTCLGNGHFASVLLHRVLTDGGYRRHVDGLRGKLAGAMGKTLERLKALGLVPVLEPKAGMFIWARLPDDIDAAAVARLALAEDVLFAPGNVFSASHSARSYLRFNVARCAEPHIFTVLDSAMQAAAAGRNRTASRADRHVAR